MKIIGRSCMHTYYRYCGEVVHMMAKIIIQTEAQILKMKIMLSSIWCHILPTGSDRFLASSISYLLWIGSNMLRAALTSGPKILLTPTSLREMAAVRKYINKKSILHLPLPLLSSSRVLQPINALWIRKYDPRKYGSRGLRYHKLMSGCMSSPVGSEAT